MKTALNKAGQDEPRILPTEMTFSVLLQKWQEDNKIRLKGGTKNRYENIIHAQILPKLGALKLTDITSATINCFLNDKITNGRLDGSGGLSPRYVRSISSVVSSALNYAVSEGFLPPLPIKISKPALVKADVCVLSLENQRTLEQHIKSNLSPTNIGILISLYTGLRIGEICALSWADIDLDKQNLHVRHTVSRVKSSKKNRKTELILDEPKTLSSKRVIPIPSMIVPLLLAYQKESSSSYVVSNTKSFVSPRTYDSRFHKILNNCHIEALNYHILRHTFATRCIQAGVDIKSLSEMLGHANVSITLNTYVHSSLEMKKSQIEKLAQLSVY